VLSDNTDWITFRQDVISYIKHRSSGTINDSDVYKAMKERYIDLKVILSASGVNLTEIDRIKE
jgi:hypothetical protein